MATCLSSSVMAQTKGFTESGASDLSALALLSKINARVNFISSEKNMLSSAQTVAELSDTSKVKTMPLKYKDALTSIYTAISDKPTPLFLPPYSQVPILLPYKDGNTLIISPLVHLISYNTLQLSDRERAFKAIKSVLFPVIYRVANSIKTDIKYIGFSICYGAKDFSDKYASADSEFALIVVPVSAIKDFAATHISEDELLKCSDVYISNMDEPSMIFKVNLSFN